MADEETTGTEPETPAESVADYDKMSLEELEESFRRGDGIITERDDAEPPRQEPVAASESEPEPDSGAAEPEQVAEATPEADAPEPETQPELDERQAELEEIRLELRKQQAEREKFEFLAGRYTGEVGHLRKQLRDLTTSRPQTTQSDADGLFEEPQATEPQPRPVEPGPDPELQSKVAELEQSERARAIDEEWRSFLQSNDLSGLSSDEATELLRSLAPSIQKQYEPYQGMALNAKSSRKIVRVMLDSAYADHKLAKLREAKAEARARKASQVSDLKKAKQAAVVSGSGATPAPRPAQKAVEDMTAEEADAALIREFGDGHHRRRRL